MTDQRPTGRLPLGAIILGLLLGLIGGGYYAIVVDPVTYENVSPDYLAQEEKAEYVLLISQSFLVDNNLQRARSRLNTIDEEDVVQYVTNLADDAFLQGASSYEVQALTALSQALGGQPSAAEVFSVTLNPTTQVDVIITSTQPLVVPTATHTPTPFATSTVFVPPATPTLIGAGSFGLYEREDSCFEDQAPTIEVVVEDEFGNGIPNVEILVRWNTDSERFYTGLKPQLGLGFADYILPADETYTLELVGLSDPVAGLTSYACTTENGDIGSPFYYLRFLPTGSVIPEDSP